MAAIGISITKLYTILSEKMDKETAEALTTYIEKKIPSEIESKSTHLATKEDIANTRAELKEEIANAKHDLVKWLVGIFIVIVLMILGLYFKN